MKASFLRCVLLLFISFLISPWALYPKVRHGCLLRSPHPRRGKLLMGKGISTGSGSPSRKKFAPAAAAKFATQIKHTGKLSDQTVVLAATQDVITPEGNTQWLINQQKTAAAKAKLLVLWNKPADQYTKFTAAGQPDTSGPKANGTGHCNFTADQYLAVAYMLADAVENNGKLDTGVVRSWAVSSAEGLSITPRTGRMQKYYQK